jgi:hypothetical protein
MGYKLRLRTRLNTLQKGAIVVGGASILALVAYITVIVNTANVESSLASHRNLLVNDPINNGEVVSGFTWDENPSTKADVGANAISVSTTALCVDGAVDTSMGLSAGNSSKDINLKLKPSDGLNADGIDISMDFRRMEPSGNFYTRGSTFNFGMEDGKICIKYKLTAVNGKSYMINEKTQYEIPEDMTFRNYRFIYTPSTGKGEVMVNNATIWSNQGVEQSRLTWKTDEEIVIGEGMNGGGKGLAIIDNLVVRKTGTSNKAPMDLLSFAAEMENNQMMIKWFTAKENGTEFYKIERSTDTKNYTEIGRIKAAGQSESLKAYALIDKEPVLGVAYYRLGLTNNLAKSVWFPVIAFRLKPEMLPGATNTPMSSLTK